MSPSYPVEFDGLSCSQSTIMYMIADINKISTTFCVIIFLAYESLFISQTFQSLLNQFQDWIECEYSAHQTVNKFKGAIAWELSLFKDNQFGKHIKGKLNITHGSESKINIIAFSDAVSAKNTYASTGNFIGQL